MPHPEIARLRLLNQRIAGERCASPAEVVRWMGAMQAQDYGQAIWAVGLRTLAPSLAAVEQAIAARQVVLTWPMRGTLHLVPAEDAAWMLQLLTPRRLKGAEARRKQLGLDLAVIERSKTLLQEALRGGRQLARPALMQLLEQAGISTQGQGGYHLLWHTAQEGLICFGPMQGKQQTFVLLDEWVPTPRQLSADEGMAELARRYFTSHGPATVHDFANWAGLPLGLARQGLEAVRAGLVKVETEGKTYWLAEPVGATELETPDLQLLPGFDEYLLGYQDRGAVLAAAHASKIVPGGNGIFKPMIVVDGQIVGTWQRTLVKSTVNVTANFFGTPLISPELLRRAVGRYCSFQGLPLGVVRGA